MKIIVSIIIAIVSGLIVNAITFLFSHHKPPINNSNNINITQDSNNTVNVSNSFNENSFNETTTITNYNYSIDTSSHTTNDFSSAFLIFIALCISLYLLATNFSLINVTIISLIIIFITSYFTTKKNILKFGLDIDSENILISQMQYSFVSLKVVIIGYIAITIRYFLHHFDIIFTFNSINETISYFFKNPNTVAPGLAALCTYIIIIFYIFRMIVRNISISTKLFLITKHPDSITYSLLKGLKNIVNDKHFNKYSLRKKVIFDIFFFLFCIIGIDLIYMLIKFSNATAMNMTP